MNRLPFLTTFLLLALLPLHAAAEGPPPSRSAGHQDIRILIDVSGSMKRTDPDNLRVPALRLITGLLPRGSRAGVWTFGRYVNMLIPLAFVDEAWRERAMAAAARINSHGLYTNMEDTLTDATWDWKRPPTDGARRSLILLTDGYVDISADAAENAASRERILNEILPRLQAAGVTVHTIALSREADHALLRQLATASGGRYEQAAPDRLERLFLRLFEKAAEPETLPLEDNRVLVDERIEEMTLLIFRRPGAPATRLTTPRGVSFDAQKRPPNVRWHQEARYDLITIDRPMAGTWRITADQDPDNRVMVVTDFNVNATRLPDNLAMDEPHTFLVQLTEGGRTIEKKDFLHFIEVRVRQENDQGEQWEWLLLDNGRRGDTAPGDGIYTLVLQESLQPGSHRLVVNVDGTTFRRRLERRFHVHASPVETFIAGKGGAAVLHVIPRAGMIEPDTMTVRAHVSTAGAYTESRDVPRTHHNQWRLDLSAYDPGLPHGVEIEVTGTRPSGRPVQVRVGPLHFGSRPLSEPVPEPASGPESGTHGEEGEHSPVETPAEDAPPAEVNWLWVALQVLFINALVIGGFFYGYRRWLRLEVRLPKSWQQAGQQTGQQPQEQA